LTGREWELKNQETIQVQAMESHSYSQQSENLEREMPIKVTPYKHQKEAFIFALKVMGLIGV